MPAPYEIDLTAANAAATAAHTTAVNAANAEKAAQTAQPLDPMIGKQALVDEATDRKNADAAEALARTQALNAIAKFVGQAAVGDSAPNYSRDPGDNAMPVNNGDTLETAIAKILKKVTQHPLPPGTLMAYYGNLADVPTLNGGAAGNVTSNSGPFWALCNGTAITGNSVTIPDLRGRFLVGAQQDAAGTAGVPATNTQPVYGKGDAGGENFHQLLTPEMPQHDHNVQVTTTTEPGKWTVSGGSGTEVEAGDGGAIGGSQSLISTVSEQQRGGNKHHENRPPYHAVYYIIRTSRTNY